MPIRAKRIYDPAEDGDGHRLLVMRLWPRGVRKERVDAWDKGLAPTRELLSAFRSGAIDWPEYARRFTMEMAQRPDAIGSLAKLRERAAKETITLLCSCKDPSRCHRTLLQEMVEGACLGRTQDEAGCRVVDGMTGATTGRFAVSRVGALGEARLPTASTGSSG